MVNLSPQFFLASVIFENLGKNAWREVFTPIQVGKKALREVLHQFFVLTQSSGT